MVMYLIDDCKIRHLQVHCLEKVLREVDLLKAIEFMGLQT